MQQWITNADLMAIEMDFQNILRQPGLGLLMASKIKRYRDQFKLRDQSLRESANAIVDKYVMKDEKNAPVITMEKTPTGVNPKYQFISAEAEQSYNNEMKELMSKGFNIEI